MSPAPELYTPEYCDQVKVSCQDKMLTIDSKVDTLDKRMWTLILMAGSNLLATVGGLLAILFTGGSK